MRLLRLLCSGATVLLFACTGGSNPHAPLCDPMVFPGVYPTSLSLGTNGTGYLATAGQVPKSV